MTPLLPPTIHSNGTSLSSLVESLMDAMNAAQALRKAMAEAAPNARDYYPQGPEAYGEARAAWRERTEMVERVFDDMQMLTLKIALANAKEQTPAGGES